MAFTVEDAATGESSAEMVTRGWSVLWYGRIPAGQSWHRHLGGAVKAARCVVV